MEHDEDLGYRAATAAFERRDASYCAEGAGWTKSPAPPGPAAEYEEQARSVPTSRHPSAECRLGDVKTDVSEIAIERSACYGQCPIYWLRLRADGSAEMFGKAFVPHLGRHRGKLHPQLFQELAALAIELGFFALDNSYSCDVTDSPTVYTSVKRAGQQKIVRHYAPHMTGPRSLRILEDTIDDYADAIEWSE